MTMIRSLHRGMQHHVRKVDRYRTYIFLIQLINVITNDSVFVVIYIFFYIDDDKGQA